MTKSICVFIILSIITIICFLNGCDSSVNNNSTVKGSSVVIITPLSQPSLNQSIEGFMAGLQSKGYGKDNIKIEVMNANGDAAKVKTLIELAISQKPKLIFVLTTPVSSAAIKLTDKARIPLIYCAVTDPVGANIVTAMEKSETLATGVSDRYPVDEQVKLFTLIYPKMKSAAILFNPAEQNSRVLVKQTVDYLKGNNIKANEFKVSKEEDIVEQTKAALNNNDCLIVNGDNLATQNLTMIINLCKEYTKPLFVGDPDSVRKGGVATVGPSYFHIGMLAGYKAAKVLNGEKANLIPSEYPRRFDYIVNVKAAQAMGISIPDKVWAYGNIWESKADLAVKR